MANPEHLKILKQGVEVWNRWRRKHWKVRPDLSDADLEGAELGSFDFRGVNLVRADLRGADLSGALFWDASLRGANFRGANLVRADLRSAGFHASDLREAIVGFTSIDAVDLSEADGLATVTHRYPSTIGTGTLELTVAGLSQDYTRRREVETFLRRAGVPESIMLTFATMIESPGEFFSAFISYSHVDKRFAQRVYADLQAQGVRCWLDEHDLKPGERISDAVSDAIRLHDRILLCCSEASLESWWVKDELRKAQERERRERRDIIIPLMVDRYLLDAWDDGLAADLRSRLAADFTGWESDNAKFEAKFERVVKALRMGEGRMESVPPQALTQFFNSEASSTQGPLDGVNGATGEFMFPRLSGQQVTDLIRGSEPLRSIGGMPGIPSTMPGVAPLDLASSGWGIVFAEDADPAIREALSPLLDHRRKLATQKDDIYREFLKSDGLWHGETKPQFLARNGVGPGPVDPRKVPYYLLIAGGPDEVPFDFQHQLGMQYAVGRIAFDTPEEYDRYARNVVEAETDPEPQARRATFFGVQHPDDNAGRESSSYLLRPLLKALSEDQTDWQIDSRLGEATTKAELGRLLGGEARPSLLFTTSHGMWFKPTQACQRTHMGALLCRDWPGPKAWNKAVPEAHYFAAHDVAVDADLRGMITFHFACFSGGVPEFDSFGHKSGEPPGRLAARPFVARLPQRLLGHQRGALAVIGRVDKAWGWSYYWRGAGNHPGAFEAVLRCLMAGEPVGHAMRFFGIRYGQLAADLASILDRDRSVGQASDQIIDLWTATNDARGYLILGDPAVRMKVETPT